MPPLTERLNMRIENISKRSFQHSAIDANKRVLVLTLNPGENKEIPDEIAEQWLKSGEVRQYVKPEDVKAKEEKLKAELVKLTTENEVLKAENKAMKEETEAVKNNLAENDKKIAELKDENKKLAKEVERLTKAAKKADK